MDFGLNEEQRAVVATVRDFVRRELIPHEDLVERLDAVPEDLAQQIRGKAVASGGGTRGGSRDPLEHSLHVRHHGPTEGLHPVAGL